jgi:urocanate hydratase
LGTIAVKNVDERLYRRLKALASLEGKTVGEEVNSALAAWLSQHAASPELLERWDELERQAAANNRAFEKVRAKLFAEHPGEFAVVTSGRLVGVFKQEKDAFREASKSDGAQAIVAHLEEKEPQTRVIELGWSPFGETTT